MSVIDVFISEVNSIREWNRNIGFPEIVFDNSESDKIEYSTSDSNKCIGSIDNFLNCKSTCSYSIAKPIKVIFNKPATIVWFCDGDKIVSKWDGEGEFSKMTGFLTCYYKKFGGESILELWEKFEESNKVVL